MKGLAPRVYGLVAIKRNGKYYPAQLIEKVEGEHAESSSDVQNKLQTITNYLGGFSLAPCHKNLLGKHDFLGGKLIDFQGFRFTGKATQKITKYTCDKARYGKAHYQSIPQLGITAKPRDTLKRIKDMKLDKVDFEGKTVMDVGCSLGAFCNYASTRGARKVLGIDNANTVEGATILSFLLGNHNIEYKPMDLLKDKQRGHFDIIFFFSMNLHVGFPDWIKNSVDELLIFEENANKSKFQTKKWLTELGKRFKKVEVIGYSSDHGNKPIIYCRK
jgi:hypothetical protein